MSTVAPAQCPECGDPIAGPPLMKRCATNHKPKEGA